MKNILVVMLALVALLAACKKKTAEASEVSQSQAVAQFNDPPPLSTDLSVDDAYAAIPHRRTVWAQDESNVPAAERGYLHMMFQVEDEAVAARVSGFKRYAAQEFDQSNVDEQFDQLITFVRGAVPPSSLASYHQHIMEALLAQQQFFREWKSAGGQFSYAQQVANHPAVRKASGELKAAYNELMSKYPQEGQTNKDAFFDYHCALDFI